MTQQAAYRLAQLAAGKCARRLRPAVLGQAHHVSAMHVTARRKSTELLPRAGPMRLISFALTTGQIRNRTTTVTRRLWWKNLKPGTLLQPVEKAPGLKKGADGE
jgi:hypothetical protein